MRRKVVDRLADGSRARAARLATGGNGLRFGLAENLRVTMQAQMNRRVRVVVPFGAVRGGVVLQAVSLNQRSATVPDEQSLARQLDDEFSLPQ
jgi:hypothetical protein